MPKRSTNAADVMVIGAGTAGAMAALLIARTGRHVVLLDGASLPQAAPASGWLNARAADVLKSVSLSVEALVAHTIDEVAFCSPDLAKTTKPKIKGCPGYLIDRQAFDQRLVVAACKAGADFRDQHRVTRIKPLETGVELTVDNHEPVFGRLLVVATAVAPSLLQQVGVLLPVNDPPTWSAHLEHRKSRTPSGARQPCRVTVAIGLTPDNGFCMAIERPDLLSITLHSKGRRDEVAQRVSELARVMAQRGHLSTDLSVHGPAWCAPNHLFSALEVDSHVGKHTLVIGDAGGFFASTSHEAVFPAMWSAAIAVRVIETVADFTYSQDALITFNTEWRLEMADFLRPPNTDLQLLTPLVFTNQPMADRMAAAFFRGENI